MEWVHGIRAKSGNVKIMRNERFEYIESRYDDRTRFKSNHQQNVLDLRHFVADNEQLLLSEADVDE